MSSTVDLSDSVLSGNTSELYGGGINLYDCDSISISGVTISNNTAANRGGGVYAYGATFEITGSSIFGNESNYRGGGIILRNGSDATITNSEIFGNTANSLGGGIFTEGTTSDPVIAEIINSTITANSGASGGGIYISSSDSAIVANTIVAQNTVTTADPDIHGVLATGSIYNLVGDGTGQTGLTDGVNGNQVGTTATPIDPEFVDSTNEDWHLSSISPAINAGDNYTAETTYGLTTDLDGNERTIYQIVDIGAYEYNDAILVSTLSDDSAVHGTNDYTYGKLSLREAIYLAYQNTGADTITFDPSMFVDGNDDPLPGIITLGGTQLDVDSNVTITGQDAGLLEINANGYSRVFSVESSCKATLSGMTITGGSTTNDGGGIFGNTGSDITIEDAVITANSADRGGGVFTLGSLSVDNVDFTYNTATGTLGFGGGLSGGGGSIVNIVDSWFYQNDADSYGGGMFFSNSEAYIDGTTLENNTSTYGAGFYAKDQSDVEVDNSTFSGNIASYQGGGIYLYDAEMDVTNSDFLENEAENAGGGILCRSATLDVSAGSSFTDNETLGSGGGIWVGVSSTVDLSDSVLSGNTSELYGGGINLYDCDSISISGVTISNNTAANREAVVFMPMEQHLK